jgi:hypothetical protein
MPSGMADLSMWGQSGASPRHGEARHGVARRGFPQPGKPQRKVSRCREAAAGAGGGCMKRFGLAFLVLIVPGLLFLNAWQGYRYNELSGEVSALEKQQQQLLEANRDTIARIAYEQSPARVEEKALKDFRLVPADPAHVTRVLIQGAASAGRAQ